MCWTNWCRATYNHSEQDSRYHTLLVFANFIDMFAGTSRFFSWIFLIETCTIRDIVYISSYGSDAICISAGLEALADPEVLCHLPPAVIDFGRSTYNRGPIIEATRYMRKERVRQGWLPGEETPDGVIYECELSWHKKCTPRTWIAWWLKGHFHCSFPNKYGGTMTTWYDRH